MKISINNVDLKTAILGVVSISVFAYAIYTNFLQNTKIFKNTKKEIKKIEKKIDTNANKIKIEKGLITFLKYKCKNEANTNYCNELAKIYLKQNKKNEAEKIFEESCNAGNSKACFYFASLKINKNEKKLEEINEIVNDLEFSCKNNFAQSCSILAILNLKYFNNKQKAIKLLKKACKLKDSFACSKLKNYKNKKKENKKWKRSIML